MANVKPGKFHDLRRTAIRNWFVQGLKELEVMTLAGHADFKTTHKFYLDISNDLKKRAKQAVSKGLCKKLVQIGASSNLTNKADEVKCVNACNEMT